MRGAITYGRDQRQDRSIPQFETWVVQEFICLTAKIIVYLIAFHSVWL